MVISSTHRNNIEDSDLQPGKYRGKVASIFPARPEAEGSSLGGHRVCPKCGATKVAKSRAYRSDRIVMKLLRRRPYRCLRCYNRFWHAEFVSTGARRRRTWTILGVFILAFLLFIFFGGFGFSADWLQNNSTTISSPQNTRTTNEWLRNQVKSSDGQARQRKLIEVSGFQPPRSAKPEIQQLFQAGLSHRKIKGKLGAAKVLAVNTLEPDTSEPLEENQIAPTDLKDANAEPQQAEKSLSDRDRLEADIQSMLEQWRRAWENGDSERYLEFYSHNFRPASGIPLERWQQQRIERVIPSKRIRLGLRNISIAYEDDQGVAVVSFTQDYYSANYTDTTRKQMRLSKIANRWYIVTEQELSKIDTQ